MSAPEVSFEVRTPQRQAPRKAGEESSLKVALEDPGEIRRSRSDHTVLLLYKAGGARRQVCAVTKQADDRAFLVTACPTDAIKEGMRIWPRSLSS